MLAKYEAWIQAYVASQPNGFVRGKCGEATTEMVKAFPELRRAAGFVYDVDWGREQHWWCVTSDGEIVDPTASQYLLIEQYEELDLNDPATRTRVPTGVCAYCGDGAYNGDTVCSDRCRDSYIAYLNSPEEEE